MPIRKLTAWEHRRAEAARLEAEAGTADDATAVPSPGPVSGPAERPPLGGTGSGRDAWAAYVAHRDGRPVADYDDLTRDELVAEADRLGF